MIAALFVPEIIVSNSWHQWRLARRLHKEWLHETKVVKGSKEDMGMVSAFFVVMGGCIIDGVETGRTATITPDGFIKLTKLGLLGRGVLSKGDIKDKGKADSLAKVLVCAQATWMVVQCATRKLSHLPVSLLEYHVAIQVGYALTIYYFWWHKPKDVGEPIAVLNRSDIDDKECSDVYRLVNQSRRFVVDDLISTGFEGHSDAMMAAAMGIPTSVLHGLAWNSHFPSQVEKWIWRVSSVGVGVAPQCMLLHFVLSEHIVQYTWIADESDHMYKRIHKQFMDKFPVAAGSERRIKSVFQMRLGEFAFYVTTWLNLEIYTAFSMSLAVLSFMSLRSVPDGTYKTIPWGDYWPHF
ncbi:hypothetical protein DFP73DRAFT_587776 [Morchella snyderi]|nr:hypothetical protein DFP73DRAFT_587776 [Morchella snyderi]